MATVISGYEYYFSTIDWTSANSPSEVTIEEFINIPTQIWYGTEVITVVTFGVGVEVISGGAFYSCPNLVTVHIGPDVTHIDEGFAVDCCMLTTITVDPANIDFHIDNGILYKKNGENHTHTMVQYPFGNGRSLTIPNTVVHIAPYFAQGCSSDDSLDTIIFETESSVETIGSGAFTNNDIISITLPESIVSIAANAFQSCYALAVVYLSLTTAATLSANGADIILFSSARFRGTIQTVSFQTTAPTCFPAGTPIQTDQGAIAIEKVTTHNTIRGKKVLVVTRSVGHKSVVHLPRNSLYKNVPSQDTCCSLEHRIFYNGRMTKARDLVSKCESVTKERHDGAPLFNVLLPSHSKMVVSNLVVETLHPENACARAPCPAARR
jgi:hypothetical protein